MLFLPSATQMPSLAIAMSHILLFMFFSPAFPMTGCDLSSCMCLSSTDKVPDSLLHFQKTAWRYQLIIINPCCSSQIWVLDILVHTIACHNPSGWPELHSCQTVLIISWNEWLFREMTKKSTSLKSKNQGSRKCYYGCWSQLLRKDHTLIVGPLNTTLCGKNFADGMKLGIIKWRDYSGLSIWALKAITNVLRRS